MKKLKKILSSDWSIAVVLFIVAAMIRAIPEIKAGIWPIGYDTFNTYAAELASYQGPLINWLRTANILYFLFLPLKILGLSPNLIMKIFGPILYGGLIVSFFVFARSFLKFNRLKAFILAILTLFQLATLRISWDLYRNELSLIFLFLSLIYLPKIAKIKYLILLIIFAILVALSNQLVTVILLVILLVQAIYHSLKHQWETTVSLLITLVIVGMIFTIVISSSGQILYDPNVIFTSEKNYFWRYFYRYNFDMPNWLLRQIIGTLFWLLYAWLLPLVIIGFWTLRKNLVLTSITLWLLFGTFSSLIFFGNGLMVWERWLFMLVFPFAIYTVAGAEKVGQFLGGLKGWASKFPRLALILVAVFWAGFIGFFIWRAVPFLTKDYRQAKPPMVNNELNTYFPRTMIHNSIGIWQIPDTLECIKWLDHRAPPGSVILVDSRYRGLILTQFDLDDRYIITNPWSETIQSSTLEKAKKMNYWPVYLIWNVSRAIPDFDRIYSAGDRGIYQALPSFKGD